MPSAKRLESTGSATLASTTVVSACSLVNFSTFASAAFVTRASFNAATTSSPPREVLFMSVVG